MENSAQWEEIVDATVVDWKNHTQKTIHDQTTKNLVVVDFLGNASIPFSFSFFFFLRGVELVNGAGLEGTGVTCHRRPGET